MYDEDVLLCPVVLESAKYLNIYVILLELVDLIYVSASGTSVLLYLKVLSCPDPNFVFPKLHGTLNIIQLIWEW